MKQPYRPGQFVWCMFPYDQQPDAPGEKPHATYILEIGRRPSGEMIAACAYTTSQNRDDQQPLPIGVLRFGTDRAEQLGQNRAFLMDLRRVAYIPLSKTFFHTMHLEGHGILTGNMPDKSQKRILNEIAKVIRRPELIVELGPFRPSKNRSLRKPPEPSERGGR